MFIIYDGAKKGNFNMVGLSCGHFIEQMTWFAAIDIILLSEPFTIFKFRHSFDISLVVSLIFYECFMLFFPSQYPMPLLRVLSSTRLRVICCLQSITRPYFMMASCPLVLPSHTTLAPQMPSSALSPLPRTTLPFLSIHPMRLCFR